MQVNVYKITLRLHEDNRRYMFLATQTPAGRILRSGNWVDAPKDIGAIVAIHQGIVEKVTRDDLDKQLFAINALSNSQVVG